MENDKNQILTLENREHFCVSAVEDVESFSEEEILLKTACGGLRVCGSALRLEDLSTKDGKVEMVGRVNKLEFFREKEKHGFFKSIFR